MTNRHTGRGRRKLAQSFITTYSGITLHYSLRLLLLLMVSILFNLHYLFCDGGLQTHRAFGTVKFILFIKNTHAVWVSIALMYTFPSFMLGSVVVFLFRNVVNPMLTRPCMGTVVRNSFV